MVSGLLIFVSRGSFFQLMVTTLICLGFNFSAAWFQPYESQLSNLFKVATEVSLLITLCVARLLQMDLSAEKLPAMLSADGGGVNREAVGRLLVLANTLVPMTSLVVGFASFGLGVVTIAINVSHCEMDVVHCDMVMAGDNENERSLTKTERRKKEKKEEKKEMEAKAEKEKSEWASQRHQANGGPAKTENKKDRAAPTVFVANPFRDSAFGSFRGSRRSSAQPDTHEHLSGPGGVGDGENDNYCESASRNVYNPGARTLSHLRMLVAGLH
jgi:hypothetical protein